MYFYANQFKCGSRFHTEHRSDHGNLSQQIDAVTSVSHTTNDNTHPYICVYIEKQK